ncbi:MAG: P-loop NTPase [Ideonella sp.]|nr:P-loop NTPase [Ideonella sp.]
MAGTAFAWSPRPCRRSAQKKGPAAGRPQHGRTSNECFTAIPRQAPPKARVTAITSGKGGVGKTLSRGQLWAAALARLGERVLVLDADLGLANLDVC